nr:flocculation protein FLO11-like [Osmia lignaria]
MVHDSSSKHHTANMKLLLVILACLAASSAVPVEKQKRDILPGDPRYGTDQHHHHHHHENVVEDARASSGYSYSFPETENQRAHVHLPSNSYGPPGYQPGTPLNKEFVAPTSDVIQYSTPVPNFQVSDSVQTPQLTNTYIPVNTEVKKTVTTATISVPVEKTNFVKAAPPATSYGTPVAHHTTNTLDASSDSRVETTLKTVKTQLQDHQLLDVPSPQVTVTQQAPVSKGVAHYATGVKSIPVTTTFTKNLQADTLFTDNLPTFQSSIGGFYNAPSYSLPTTVYTNLQPSYSTFHTGFTGLGVDYPLRTLSHQVQFQQPLTAHFSNAIPTSYSFPQTSYQLPQTLTQFVQHSEPSVSTVQNYSPVQTQTKVQPVQQNLETVTHVEPAHHKVETLTPVHKVQSVEVLPQRTVVESVKTNATPLTHTQVQKGPIGDFFQNFSENLPSLPSFPSLPSLPSLPSFPSLPGLPTLSSTPAPQIESASPVSTQVFESKDSIAIENPLLSADNNLKGTVVQHVTPANEYVQPTAANGGYVY